MEQRLLTEYKVKSTNHTFRFLCWQHSSLGTHYAHYFFPLHNLTLSVCSCKQQKISIFLVLSSRILDRASLLTLTQGLLNSNQEPARTLVISRLI